MASVPSGEGCNGLGVLVGPALRRRCARGVRIRHAAVDVEREADDRLAGIAYCGGDRVIDEGRRQAGVRPSGKDRPELLPVVDVRGVGLEAVLVAQVSQPLGRVLRAEIVARDTV